MHKFLVTAWAFLGLVSLVMAIITPSMGLSAPGIIPIGLVGLWLVMAAITLGAATWIAVIGAGRRN